MDVESTANINEIIERLKDPSATFTADEVTTYATWAADRALKSDYQLTRIADAHTLNVETTARVEQAMNDLLSLWDPAPMAPTLEVVSYGQE